MDAERILHVSLRNTEAGMRKAGWISSAAVLRHRKLDHSHVEFSAVCFLGWARNHGMEASKFPDAQRAFVVTQGEEGPWRRFAARQGSARRRTSTWRRHYNEERPHSAIGNIPPSLLVNSAGATSPPNLSKAENSRPEWSRLGSSAFPE